MVAFSAVSMANTIEIKEVEVTVEKTITTTTFEDDKRDLCAEIASIRMEQFENNYGCIEEGHYYNALWNYYYGRC